MSSHLPVWKKAPFLRLLFPFFAGILLQWLIAPPIVTGWLLLLSGIAVTWLLTLQSAAQQFVRPWLKIIPLHIALLGAGMLPVFYTCTLHHPQSIVQRYHTGDTLLLVLQEPPAPRNNSFKATASVCLYTNSVFTRLQGYIIVYLPKDSTTSLLQYGSRLLIHKPLQPISYSGNPGSFNYRRYCALNNLYFQVYLTSHDYVTAGHETTTVRQWLYRLREHLLSVIRKFVPGNSEAGLAEALLIGYKEDINKNLLQTYSNTGVVHVIAISGLHLGLIYLLLYWLCKPVEKTKWGRWLNPVFVLSGLWIFTLLAGSSPSVVRAAVMFTCLIAGRSLSRSIPTGNSLAASAFLLLCYNPYWLADTGFQLSYAALLSIILFNKPVYNLFTCNNKLVDYIWKACSVTIAAQVLTAPLIIFYFHQFPLLFLFANLLAVPLSSCILIAEILLCVVAPLTSIATFTGYIIAWLIRLMNAIVAFFDQLPYTILHALQINTVQVGLLYMTIAGLAWWWLYKHKKGIGLALICLLYISTIRSLSILQTGKQQKMIVYNIPRHRAIDFISGHRYVFTGDSTLVHNDTMQQFYLAPSRTLFRTAAADTLRNLSQNGSLYRFGNRNILLVTKPLVNSPELPDNPLPVDVLILSGNPTVYITRLVKYFRIGKVVIDNSNSAYKTSRWIQECASLTIDCFIVAEQGAFVLNLY